MVKSGNNQSKDPVITNEDKELIIEWFEHIAQIAADRKTANGYIMRDSDALDEIRLLAKDSADYIKNHING